VSPANGFRGPDVDPNVLAEGVADDWDYSSFSTHGIFTELGEGLVDFPVVFAILMDAGFRGWVVVETNIATEGDRS
jgi:sugar phosphate isomerase/epimerase